MTATGARSDSDHDDPGGGVRASRLPARKLQPRPPARGSVEHGQSRNSLAWPVRDEDDPSTYLTPLVRRLAAEHGVDVSNLAGTGAGGRIRKDDVLRALGEQEVGLRASTVRARPARGPAAPKGSSIVTSGRPNHPPVARGVTEPLSGPRPTLGGRMVESLQTSAQLTTVVEADVTVITRLCDSARHDFAARNGVDLCIEAFFAVAATESLKQHPLLNARIDTERGEVTYFDRQDLAISIDTEQGLAMPVIADAGDLSVSGLARKIADVKQRARAMDFASNELTEATFTLVYTGSRGTLFDTHIINQPQVAILGTGAIVKRPVVVNHLDLGETIAVRHMCYLGLTYDHRLIDGAEAAHYLADVKRRLELARFEI